MMDVSRTLRAAAEGTSVSAHKAYGCSSSAQRGYTLIEILIVLFIISIVSTVALLTIGRSDTRDMENFVQEVTQMISLAEEQAMLNPTVLGLTFDKENFYFNSLQKNNWQPVEDKNLNEHAIPSNLEVTIEGQAAKPDSEQRSAVSRLDPQIVISTNGDVTPFIIYVGKKGQKPRYVIRGEANGQVSSHALS